MYYYLLKFDPIIIISAFMLFFYMSQLSYSLLAQTQCIMYVSLFIIIITIITKIDKFKNSLPVNHQGTHSPRYLGF